MIDLSFAKEVLEAEADAVRQLVKRVGEEFARAGQLVLECRGRVAVTGVGKAGIVGQKISATLASTGTPSFWLQASEARHGDLGRIAEADIVLVLSNSGETEEIVWLLPAVKKIGAKVIALTGNPKSTVALHSDIVLDIGPLEEACSLGLAPSASSTAMLALGDALALTVAKAREFTKEDYALYHPGGELGRKLLKVEHAMRTGDANPVVRSGATVSDAIDTMTNTAGRPGATSVVDEHGHLVGFFTDGDLRRRLQEGADFLHGPIDAVMTLRPKTIRRDALASEANHVLKQYRIDQLPVVDEEGRVVGVLDVQDLLDVGKV